MLVVEVVVPEGVAPNVWYGTKDKLVIKNSRAMAEKKIQTSYGLMDLFLTSPQAMMEKWYPHIYNNQQNERPS